MKRKSIIITNNNILDVWSKLELGYQKGNAMSPNNQSAEWIDDVHRVLIDMDNLIFALIDNECIIPQSIKRELTNNCVVKLNEKNDSFFFEVPMDDPHDLFQHLQLIK